MNCRLAVAFCLTTFSWAQGPAAQDVTLELNRSVVASRSGSFRIPVSAGQYLHVIVRPNNSPVTIRLLAPGGTELTSVVNPAGEQRELPVSQIAAESGVYRLKVEPADADAPPRELQIRLVELRSASPDDQTRIDAERALEAGKRLQAQGAKESLQQAIAKFDTALPLWRALSDKISEGRTFDTMGDAYWSLGQGAKAGDCYKQALALARASGDLVGEASALSNMGVATSLKDSKAALAYFEQSLTLSRKTGEVNLEATTLSNVGSVYIVMGDPAKALDYARRASELKHEAGDMQGEMLALTNVAAVLSRLGQTHEAVDALRRLLPIRRKLHDQRGEANTLSYLATTYSQLGEPDQALEMYRESLPLMRASGDRRGELRTMANVGVVQMSLGNPQEALVTFQDDLPVSRELGDRGVEGILLTNIARAYLQLGDAQTALDYTNRALIVQRSLSDKRGEGVSLGSVGAVYAYMGNADKALDSFQQGLTLLREVNDQGSEADLLNNIAALYLKRGDARSALPYAEAALAAAGKLDDRRRKALAQVSLGSVYISLGRKQEALEALNEGKGNLLAIGDRIPYAKALYYLARLAKDNGEWERARELLDEALRIDEEVRATVTSRDLRSAYFATVLDQYDLRIDVLMQLNKARPGDGYDVQAFETSERERARSLLDLLSDARGGIRRGVDPSLLQRERILTAQLRAKSERQIELLSGKKVDAKAALMEKDIRELTTQYHELEAKILASSPQSEAFVQPQPLTLAEFQHKFLDPGTILLQYAIGEERSFVWVVSPTFIRSSELPKRAVLEPLARRAHDSLASADGGSSQTSALRDLSRAVLGPVAQLLGSKRLLIVADGALQYVPFSALPVPSSADTPLVVQHEIVNLPSASTMAFLRTRREQRTRPTRTLAVVADPVFSPDDPRLSSESRTATARNQAPGEATRSASGFDPVRLDRLTFTRREAVDILALVPAEKKFAALDFDASRTVATSGALGDYRFVHIASHGLVNSLHPELSSIVLSMVDRNGHAQNGFLQTTDVYNLRLKADLVVLSACQTALGQEVRGEGLVGLTRAFMYAGSSRVVASLWTVPDASTAELMTRFYKGMLTGGLRPAAALRQAQISIWKEQRWARPYYWAAFTMQGEWN